MANSFLKDFSVGWEVFMLVRFLFASSVFLVSGLSGCVVVRGRHRHHRHHHHHRRHKCRGRRCRHRRHGHVMQRIELPGRATWPEVLSGTGPTVTG